jgi:hypothetical protein
VPTFWSEARTKRSRFNLFRFKGRLALAKKKRKALVEKVVDLTAMLLGFRLLYASGCYKEKRSYNGTTWRRIGYLSREEVQLANNILAPTPPNLLLVFTKSRFAKILILIVAVAAWYGAVYGIPEQAPQPTPPQAQPSPPPAQRKAASLPPGMGAVAQPGIPAGWLQSLGAR